MSIQPDQHRPLTRVLELARLIVLASGIWLLGSQQPSDAQDVNDKPIAAQSSDNSQPTTTEEAAQEKERAQQAAIAGLMVLGLVAVVLVLFLLLTIWWAHRLRRNIEKPLPKQHPGDPLWYLRKGTGDEIESEGDAGSESRQDKQ